MAENILVLLSSYNGEKYIKEQIDSILAQDGVNVKILVRDDGSSDRTPQILEHYKQEGRLDYYIGKNIGWKKSFIQLVLDAPDSDYYAFADQDDYWLPEKLKMAITCMNTMPEGPKLYNSNGSLWKDGRIVGKTCTKVLKYDKCSRFITPFGQGSTQVFNRDMLQIVKNNRPHTTFAHDAWFARVAILLGVYFYDNNSYILYRQHDNNQIGAEISEKDKFLKRINQYTKFKNTHYLDFFAKDLLCCYGSLMNEESYNICYNISNYRYSASCFLKVLFSPNYKCHSLLATLGFKYRVLMRML